MVEDDVAAAEPPDEAEAIGTWLSSKLQACRSRALTTERSVAELDERCERIDHCLVELLDVVPQLCIDLGRDDASRFDICDQVVWGARGREDRSERCVHGLCLRAWLENGFEERRVGGGKGQIRQRQSEKHEG